MHSTTALATVVSMGSFLLASGSPTGQSSKMTIQLPTGGAAVTAAPPVPTFGTVPVEHADVSDVAAAALGDSNVVNDCAFPVYLYVCDQSSCGAEVTVQPNGGEWSAPITSTTEDGVSIKIGTTSGEVEKPILQLEYTNANGLVYFDASQVNGNPFGSEGYWMGDLSGLHETCSPPCTDCSFVYNTPTDGTVFNTANTDSIGFTLCAA
ncbi:MAG: hypothetical protein ASARMPRED_007286 [Alectoria sarmentosa]|nr:MAG: hypothetical protein ASARMPRED_007286 [Alectoria sarmentosa]